MRIGCFSSRCRVDLERCSIVDDRSSHCLYVISKVSFYCPQDVPAKVLRMLFLSDTRSST